MTLEELKTLLQIPIGDTSQDSYLKMKLDEAVDFVKHACNRDFMENSELKLPPVAKGVVATYVSYELNGNTGIKSESIAGMSQTFESSEERDSALIGRLKSAGLRRVRFSVL